MKIPPALSRKQLVPVLLALGLGTIGGAVFDTLRLPLAWMVGAMCATAFAAMSGVDLKIPGRLRGVMITILGLMLGSAFTPDTLERAGRWLPSLCSLLLFVAVVVALLGYFLRRKAGFGPATAFFSATPGGITPMIIMGSAMGGDERTISLIHTVRVMLAVLVIPIWFRLFHGYEPQSTIAMGRIADISPWDAALLALSAVVGYWLASRARIPTASLIGPMILSALAHLTGMTAAHPPGIAVALAQVVIGAAIGCRFAGVSVARVLGVLLTGVATTVMMLTLAVGFAAALDFAFGLPFQALLLAFAPGGLAEMSLVSLSMGIDTAFVSTHHLVRILLIVIFAPVVFRWVAGRDRASLKRP